MTSRLPIEQEVKNLTSYFASQSFNVTQEWLHGCIQYFRAEKPNCTDSEMKVLVMKQWELSDLRDSSSGCLPSNLNSHKKITLRGKYVLQIETVINISVSAYSQVQKIRKVDIENVQLTEKKPEAWEPKSSRMLKISLCDGPHLAEAIEYHPLPMLYEHITPGTKIMIMGPVDCRHGCLFLKSENLKLIGGEVDSLLITNHMENVLARTLNLPENENPYANQIQESSLLPSIVPESSAESNFSRTVPSNNKQTEPRRYTSHIQTLSGTRTNQTHNRTKISVNRKEEKISPEVVHEVVDLDVSGWADDDLFVDDDAFLEIEEQHLTSNQIAVTASTSTNSGTVFNKTVGSKHSVLSVSSSKIAPPKKPPSNNNQSDSSKETNSHKSFLASEDYVDAMLLDEWEEEINNEFTFDTSSNITISNDSKNQVTKVTPVNKPLSTVTNNFNSNLLPNQHQSAPGFSRDQLQFQKPGSVQLGQRNAYQNTPNSSRGQHLIQNPGRVAQAQPNPISPSASRGQLLFKKPGSVMQGKPEKLSVPSWSKDTSCAQSSTSAKTQETLRSYFKPATSSSHVSGLSVNSDYCSSTEKNTSSERIFNTKSSKVEPILNSKGNELTSPFLISKPYNTVFSKNSSPPSNTFDTDEDWADAYVNSQNFSFTKNSNDLDGLKSISLEAPRQSPFSHSMNNMKDVQKHWQKSPLSSKKNDVKESDSKLSDRKRNPFQNAQTRFPAAFCGPSDASDNLDVILVPPNEIPMDSSTVTKLPSNSKTKTISPSSTSRSLCESNRVAPWTCPITSPEPFEYLIHILYSPVKPCGIHKVKAMILTLLSPLSVDPEAGWLLRAKIADGTATLDVTFSSDVLDEIIGLSHKEFKRMKREASKNPLIKEKLVKVLKSSKQKLIDLNCILSIKFEDDKTATIVNIAQVTQQDVNKLKWRLGNV